MKKRWLLIAILCVGTDSLEAQAAIRPSGVHRQISAAAPDSGARFTRLTILGVRTLTGGGGMMLGLFGGAWLGAVTAGPCNCDDPGLDGAITGGLIGGLLGTTIGSGLPRLGSKCSSGERFGLALGGSLVGLLGGIGAASVIPGEAAKVTVVAVGAPVGAALMQWNCERTIAR